MHTGRLAPLPKTCCTTSVSPLLRELLLKAASIPELYALGGREDRLIAALLDELAVAPVEDLHLPMPRDPALRRLAEMMLADPADKTSKAEALLAATSNERFLSLAQTSRTRDPALPPGDAVRAYLDELARNTSICQSLAASIGTVIQCGTPGCNAITAEGHRLLQRGQEAGTIRGDVTFDDFIYVVTAISIALENERASKSRIGHLVDLFLNGISVKGPA